MGFTNNLSLSTKVLTASSWLLLAMLSSAGCAQRPLPNKGTGGAQAGAAAKGTAPDKKTATMNGAITEEDASDAMPAAGSAAKSSGMNAANRAGSNAAAPAAASPARAASAGSAAPAANPKAIPACEGKVDEHACDDTTLYHCVDGAYEGRPQTCMTAAQCQAGLTTGQCGECDPGTFQCVDIELQRCDDTGAWLLETECASAELCKADLGMCTAQTCLEGDYQCTGDQLQVCNIDFTGWDDEGPACEPGLCSKDAKACLECMPMSAPTCEDDRTVMTCSAEGKLTPMSCAAPTGFCAEGACVQCNTDADCGEPMNECGTLTCAAGMCTTGSPKAKGTSCSSNGGRMCDFLGSCVHCVTDLDCNDSTKRCYLQQRCAPKDAVVATPLFSTYSVTVSPGFRATASVSPISETSKVTGIPNGDTLEGSQTLDATFLIGVSSYSTGFLPSVASGAGSTARLTFTAPADMTLCPTAAACPTITVSLLAEEIK
jgi:hypothetical protein